ncbi:hypothetical protein GGD68_005227 [Paraburkholderia fungorum]|jgi:hypothetical protein|uniref:Uncharacterized protein n=1 Tax=Paraburkholderia fungorum TaxID=134537 RepID=A0AAW3V2E5_9BURK|nr:hypothetical protein [Paraburkholderia fungorum]MBB5545315.1 hypothetical protein [Paraburkholderia fungorum]MBB6205099.1 hypothetical protein [Paraburkholderia fungorum]
MTGSLATTSDSPLLPRPTLGGRRASQGLDTHPHFLRIRISLTGQFQQPAPGRAPGEVPPSGEPPALPSGPSTQHPHFLRILTLPPLWSLSVERKLPAARPCANTPFSGQALSRSCSRGVYPYGATVSSPMASAWIEPIAPARSPFGTRRLPVGRLRAGYLCLSIAKSRAAPIAGRKRAILA